MSDDFRGAFIASSFHVIHLSKHNALFFQKNVELRKLYFSASHYSLTLATWLHNFSVFEASETDELPV